LLREMCAESAAHFATIENRLNKMDETLVTIERRFRELETRK
jgi:hypothetical protein